MQADLNTEEDKEIRVFYICNSYGVMINTRDRHFRYSTEEFPNLNSQIRILINNEFIEHIAKDRFQFLEEFVDKMRATKIQF